MRDDHLPEASVTRAVIGAFFDVYNELGFGFLEHVYVMALEYELRSRGHDVARERAVQVAYKGQLIATQRLDMVVDDRVVVETKAGLLLPPTATRQLYNYLRATALHVGLLLHFGPQPRFHRLVHRPDPDTARRCPSPTSNDPPHPLHPPHASSPSTEGPAPSRTRHPSDEGWNA